MLLVVVLLRLAGVVDAVGDTPGCEDCASSDVALLQISRSHGASLITAAFEEQRETDTWMGSDSKLAGDAQFLIHATFGPTRHSLSELSGKTREVWIQEQMQLPVESHREYYRQRVNPRSETGREVARGPCDSESRWVRHVFNARDWSKLIQTQDSTAIFVGGVWRTGVEKGELGSRWAALGNYSGYLCSVVSELGGNVILSPDICGGRRRRRGSVITMPNPAVWHATGGVANTFTYQRLRHGVVVLHGAPETCTLNEGSLLVIDGDLHRFDSRLLLKPNTPETPDSSSEICVRRHPILATNCKVSDWNFSEDPQLHGCRRVACGSPGEVGNEPSLGHQFPSYLRSWADQTYDVVGKHPHAPFPTSLAKSVVWTMKALEAKDQLRQRVAWALSQIFVASVTMHPQLTEQWVNFYDIFVRGAFGSYLRIMQEVTFNPVMGDWLTHRGSSSYEFNRREPNENFARELMQLFTIGLTELNPDGSSKRVDGEAVPSYRTPDITTFARVFTGFELREARHNVEQHEDGLNMIDPMVIWRRRHDRFPKTDLNGRFLGDDRPLCPEITLATKGAEYVFAGIETQPDALVLGEQSALFRALCGSETECKYAATVVLNETLPCAGEECGHYWISYVKVGSAYFRFHYPPCVYLFVDEPTPNETSDTTEIIRTDGECAWNVSRKWIRPAVKLDSETQGNSAEREASCIAKCKAFGGTGCWFTWAHANPGCYAHTVKDLYKASGKGGNGWCYSFPASVGKLGFSYMSLVDDCPEGTRLRYAECAEATGTTPSVSRRRSRHPPGCSRSRDGTSVVFDYKWNAVTSNDLRVCRAHVAVEDDGAVTTDNIRFDVAWGNDGAPSQGIYTLSVTTEPAFDALPDASSVLEHLTIGASPPKSNCSLCDGEVKAFSEAGVFSIFEVNGTFYRNVESRARLTGVPNSFRNPPVYVKDTEDLHAGNQATREVATLLDHLFRHPNTPVFVAKRLIQRLVTSNPSPGYIRAVGQAFRSGQYNGTVYSRNYGDLGATIAAILLHPEAQGSASAEHAMYNGALREPMVKVIHMMRAMEYKDALAKPIILRLLQDVIGQFPVDASIVFNFFDAECALPMEEDMSEPEPETESEA